jgi:predicted TIM-barrel fold metal-dependent hydrolase
MDQANVERMIVLTGMGDPARFGDTRRLYEKYPGRFDLWCGFDFRNANEPGFGAAAVKALEECHKLGAKGVGEISDKGWGFRSVPGGRTPAPGPHADDPRMDALWAKCAQLGMPVNIHVSDPVWSYGSMDNRNDGLPNGYKWRIDDKQPGILGHDALIATLARAVEKHRKTVFVACHLANLGYDLTRLAAMLDRHANLYVDVSARFGEFAPTPRAAAKFFTQYAGRTVYGTDMAYSQRMLTSTFRIMESLDEHFYYFDLDVCYDYHWPLHGLGLPDGALKKIYRDTALEVYRRARS